MFISLLMNFKNFDQILPSELRICSLLPYVFGKMLFLAVKMIILFSIFIGVTFCLVNLDT